MSRPANRRSVSRHQVSRNSAGQVQALCSSILHRLEPELVVQDIQGQDGLEVKAKVRWLAANKCSNGWRWRVPNLNWLQIAWSSVCMVWSWWSKWIWAFLDRHREWKKWSSCWHKHLAQSLADLGLWMEDIYYDWRGNHCLDRLPVRKPKRPIQSCAEAAACRESETPKAKELVPREDRTWSMLAAISGYVSELSNQFLRDAVCWSQQEGG